jgi:hypothetical protein
LPPKLGPTRKTFPVSFLNHMLKNIWVELMFPFALLPYYERVKWHTIGVTRGASAKLPHHKGHVPTYPMENKMPFVHHIIKWQGYDCIMKTMKA